MTTVLVHFFLEDVEVVGGCHSDDIFLRVPGGVQDLLIEVQAVHTDLILLPFAACTNPAWLQDLPGLAALARSLQGDVPPLGAIQHSEEVIVGSSHHHAKIKEENQKDNAVNKPDSASNEGK